MSLICKQKTSIEVFIDYDEYYFRRIVEQLRLKKLSTDTYQPISTVNINKTEQTAFAERVDYYFPGDMPQLIWKKPVVFSGILSDEHVDKLNEWLSEDKCGSDTKLLYCASRDGWQASTFHEKCDDHGPTITIIRTTEGYIFGGFCDLFGPVWMDISLHQRHFYSRSSVTAVFPQPNCD